MKTSLPDPSAEALSHGRLARANIARQIRESGGWLPFSVFMNLALHAPGLGYYAAGATKFGSTGDFVTAPELSPLFGQALAKQIAQVLRETGGDVLELGAGTGRLTATVLAALDGEGALPKHYHILETSSDLRERQHSQLAQLLPELRGRVTWIHNLPRHYRGVFFGNEVLDALPTDIVLLRDQKFLLMGVGLSDTGAFTWIPRPLEDGRLFSAAQDRFPATAAGESYLSEINLAAEGLVATLADRLEKGLLLFLDYGFPGAEFYHSQRNHGTLMCHYRQRAHDDPFFSPGLQDITAHVDFSALARAGQEAGLTLSGYTTQAYFLINCGILEFLGNPALDDPAVYLPRSNAVHKLLSPAEMGELFKVIALTKAVHEPLIGFLRGDKRHAL